MDVVCIDDDPSLRVLLKALCEKTLGARVRTAGAADEALALLADGAPPDLVLLDVMMPGADGYALCRQLRADARLRNTRIVFLSAAARFDAGRARLAGADGFL